MAGPLRLLPDPSGSHQPGSVDSPKTTLVSLAAVAERAQPLQRTAPSWRTQVQCSGRRRFADGVLAHVRTPGGPTGRAQPLFRLTRSPPTPFLRPSLTRSNRRGTDPYARWWGRGGTARCPPIPIHAPFETFAIAVGSMGSSRNRSFERASIGSALLSYLFVTRSKSTGSLRLAAQS